MLSRRTISRDLRFEVSIRLKRIRQRREISQEELAFAVEMSQASISNYENGRCEMPLSVLISVCDFLGVPVGDLLPAGLPMCSTEGGRALAGSTNGAGTFELARLGRSDVSALTN